MQKEYIFSLLKINDLFNCQISSSKIFAEKVRILSLLLVFKAKASHIGSALSIADILSVLYFNKNFLNCSNPKSKDRDRFILSKGHACVALYATLYLKGFFSIDELFSYGDNYSPFMNHASHIVQGVEFSTGSLGHGLGVACGKAFAAKTSLQKWHTFVLLSDGELQEGSNWEGFLFASHHNLSNLTVIVDYNNLQSLKTIDETISLNPLDEKLTAFGWHVINTNGHCHKSLERSINEAKFTDRPTIIIAKTIKGKGVSFMENKVSWHYKSPSIDNLESSLKEITNAS